LLQPAGVCSISKEAGVHPVSKLRSGFAGCVKPG
jgi:hypothetical protein